VEFNSTYKIIGLSVMQEENPLAHAPQRRGAEFVRSSLSLAYAIGKAGTHVMQREIGEWLERNLA